MNWGNSILNSMALNGMGAIIKILFNLMENYYFAIEFYCRNVLKITKKGTENSQELRKTFLII